MSKYTLDDFDYIQLVTYDVHCAPRGKMVARRRMEGAIKRGQGLYGGLSYFGIKDEPIVHEDFAENNNYDNIYMKPDLDTLRPVTTSNKLPYRVGQVMCHVESAAGTLEASTPRTACEIQLKRLKDELGLTMKSSFEIEFTIRKSSTKEYLGHVNKWSHMGVLNDCQDIILDMINELSGRGIHLETIQTECGPGQFEVSLDVEEGIETADRTADFKSAVKTFLKTRDLDASFMTRVDPSLGCSNGMHFNHSLWTAEGKNALLDVSQPNKLSKLGQHWLAGLIEHAPAMMAFCSPTLNCYRRVGAPWAPTYCDWGAGHRMSTFRLKLEPGDNIYLENRLPTSACNPYLVMASLIAAGLDGIKRKLSLPKALDHSNLVPKDLESSLQALEKDKVMTTELSKVVKYFTHSKRNYEVDVMKKLGNISDDERMAKEIEMYFHNA